MSVWNIFSDVRQLKEPNRIVLFMLLNHLGLGKLVKHGVPSKRDTVCRTTCDLDLSAVRPSLSRFLPELMQGRPYRRERERERKKRQA